MIEYTFPAVPSPAGRRGIISIDGHTVVVADHCHRRWRRWWEASSRATGRGVSGSSRPRGRSRQSRVGLAPASGDQLTATRTRVEEAAMSSVLSSQTAEPVPRPSVDPPSSRRTMNSCRPCSWSRTSRTSGRPCGATLERAGLSVLTAATGAEALRLIETHPAGPAPARPGAPRHRRDGRAGQCGPRHPGDRAHRAHECQRPDRRAAHGRRRLRGQAVQPHGGGAAGPCGAGSRGSAAGASGGRVVRRGSAPDRRGGPPGHVRRTATLP